MVVAGELAWPTKLLDTAQAHAPKVLLIIPAYNEQGCIWHVVQTARQALPAADVLVIDDGSADDTAGDAEMAGATVVKLPFNLGIGGAVQTGLKFARHMRYDFVLRIDGDGQHDPSLLDGLLSHLRAGDADVVVGSRFLTAESRSSITPLRRLGIRLFAYEVSLLTGATATDTTSGMVALNARAIHVLARYMPQDYPEVESRVTLHEAGLRVMEVPVPMQDRLAGVSSIDLWRSVYYALKVSVAVVLTGTKHVPRAGE